MKTLLAVSLLLTAILAGCDDHPTKHHPPNVFYPNDTTAVLIPDTSRASPAPAMNR
jgi:hypothetical protein